MVCLNENLFPFMDSVSKTTQYPNCFFQNVAFVEIQISFHTKIDAQ